MFFSFSFFVFVFGYGWDFADFVVGLLLVVLGRCLEVSFLRSSVGDGSFG